MQESHQNIVGKRIISNLIEPPLKKQKTSSLLELCMNEEWNIIIESAQEMIHVWDFEERNNHGNNSLHICCAKGPLNLLQHFHQLNIFDPKKVSKNNEGISFVSLAACNGQLETIKWLIENGCSIQEKNNDGDTCLLLAAWNGQLETVKWLIENGCSIQEKNNDGDTCLTCCMERTIRNNQMVD